MRFTSASPRPEPPTRGAAGVEPREPVEDARPVLGRDAGTVVLDAQHHLGADGGDPDGDPPVGVPRRVVEEVPHHLRELPAVAVDSSARHRACVELDRARAAADVGEHELVDVDGGVGRVRAALVEAGELEEVVDERAEALVLGEQPRRELRPVGVLRIAERNFEIGAHRRDRAPQLVGRVRHELALAGRRGLEPVEHLVHRLGQPADLVPPARHRYAAMHRRATDRQHLGADRLDRAQRAPGDHPRERADEEREERGQ